ncbi:MAG: hypothetical protein QOG62_2370 [Thermoleophilaceae bacterium]|jgi:FkbM family methyltransferase|nr:hypothetical protein [Thermoleophilaceae bacterium]
MTPEPGRSEEQERARKAQNARAKSEAAAGKAQVAEAKRLHALQKQRSIEDRLRRAELIHDEMQRLEYFDSADAFAPYLGVETPEGSYIVDTSDPSISRRLFAERTYAANQIPIVKDILGRLGRPVPEGCAIVDIGANIGTVAIGGIVAYGFRRAIAAEVHPPNRRLLEMNIILNGLEENVQVLGGLSDVDGLGRSSGRPGASGSTAVVLGGADQKVREIRLSRLDSLIDRGEVSIEDVGLVWMDVQGHEPLVLEGARQLIAHRAPMVVEFSPDHLRETPDGLARMQALVREGFSGLVDLRAGAGKNPDVRPTAEIDSIARDLGDRFTNLLLIPK